MTAARRISSSVIVPCYNAAAYLQCALESIFSQRRRPDEVIVVDDGSTDGSDLIASRFGSRIRYHLQAPAGEGAARNCGLRLAGGEYISFLDADDLWPNTAFAALLHHLEANPDLDLAYGLVEQFISPELDETARVGIHCPPGAKAARLCGSTLFRRRAFDRIGQFNPSFKYGSIMDWMARFEERGLASGLVNEIVLVRRIHETNLGTLEKHHRSDHTRILKASLDHRRQGVFATPAKN
ncbi:MAG TPA: glycosyltransferase family A protein [Stellaceae bacterium]|nr:glycosyltransferase family A protein [Stellaceae bacterium]